MLASEGFFMNKLMVSSLFVVASALTLAQVTKPVGASAKIGVVFPTHRYARDLANTWFGAGIDFKLADLSLGMSTALPTKLSVSVDWYGKGEASAVPVLLNLTGTSANGWFYSGGIGLSFTHDENQRVAGTGTGGGEKVAPGTGPGGITRQAQRSTNFCFTLAVGYNFSNVVTPVFAELRYFGHSRSELNAFGVYVGVRF